MTFSDRWILICSHNNTIQNFYFIYLKQFFFSINCELEHKNNSYFQLIFINKKKQNIF